MIAHHLRWISLIGALLSTVFASNASASTRESVFQLQQVLESRIAPIVRAMDPNAIVYVRLKTATKQNAPLPGTPFVVQDLTLKDSQGDVQIERVEVTILCRHAKLSKSVTALIQQISSGLAPVDIKVSKLPNELRPKVDAPPKVVVEPKPTGVLPNIAEALKDPRLIGFFLILVGLAVVGAGVAFTLAFQRGSQKLCKTMEAGLTQLASSVENTSSSNAPTAAITATNDNAGGTSTVNADISGAKDIFSGLPAEGLLNLLTDCYWGEFDSYAAYIWRNIPVQRRQDLLAQTVYLAEYATYLSGIKEQSLGAEQEPCYLNPLPIWHLDNTTITSVVRMHPQLRFRISSLRVAGLALQPRERIEIIRTGFAQSPAALPDFKALPPSMKRQLKIRSTVTINSIAEEKDILGMPNLSLDIMEVTPTLAWLSNLPEAVLKDELSRFSAKDLAAAWIGPDDVLEKLMKQLPQKKSDMLKSYKDKVIASRQSAAFTALHKRSIEVLKDPNAARVKEQRAA